MYNYDGILFVRHKDLSTMKDSLYIWEEKYFFIVIMAY